MAGAVAADGDKLTTISLWESTKAKLDSQKKIDSESYDSVINRLLEERPKK